MKIDTVRVCIYYPSKFAITIAANMSPQPTNSLVVIASCKISHAAIADTTDSKHKINDAIVGFMSFWATTCSVYAMPLENTPA